MDELNTSQTGQSVVGVFDQVDLAERAINDLKVAGFTPGSISVVTKDRQAPSGPGCSTELRKPRSGQKYPERFATFGR